MDWSTVSTTYPFTEESLKKMMTQAIIYEILGDCPNENLKYVKFFEEVDCIKELKCYLRVDYNSVVYCENEAWNGDDYGLIDSQGYYWFVERNNVVCGTACCETTYTLECESFPTTQSNRWTIANISKFNSGCGESTTLDCSTGLIIPCEAECE